VTLLRDTPQHEGIGMNYIPYIVFIKVFNNSEINNRNFNSRGLQ